MLYIEKDSDNVMVDFTEILMRIRVNLNEKLYINLNFKDKLKSPEYALIAEEESADNLHIETAPLAKDLIEATEKELRKYNLLKKIDNALDEKNKKLFLTLTDELKEL
jgi:uncharacterized protein YpiB (UPF0302 family)